MLFSGSFFSVATGYIPFATILYTFFRKETPLYCLSPVDSCYHGVQYRFIYTPLNFRHISIWGIDMSATHIRSPEPEQGGFFMSNFYTKPVRHASGRENSTDPEPGGIRIKFEASTGDVFIDIPADTPFDPVYMQNVLSVIIQGLQGDNGENRSNGTDSDNNSNNGKEYDVFISHASEDKEPLVDELVKYLIRKLDRYLCFIFVESEEVARTAEQVNCVE